MNKEIITDVNAELVRLGVKHGQQPFLGNWSQCNWMNTPGPIYGGDTDTCGTGIVIAPNNVALDPESQEIVFRQPVNLYELKQVVEAADCDPFAGYGCDGNMYWTYQKIKEWSKCKNELKQFLEQEYSEQIKKIRERDYTKHFYFCYLSRWKEYVENGLDQYLRAYAFFLEEQRIPDESSTLPLV